MKLPQHLPEPHFSVPFFFLVKLEWEREREEGREGWVEEKPQISSSSFHWGRRIAKKYHIQRTKQKANRICKSLKAGAKPKDKHENGRKKHFWNCVKKKREKEKFGKIIQTRTTCQSLFVNPSLSLISMNQISIKNTQKFSTFFCDLPIKA